MSDSFRDGIMSLHTRQFGKVAELFIKLLRGYKGGKTLAHDLYDHGSDESIEVKSARVYREQKLALTLPNLYRTLIKNTNEHRLLKQSQTSDATIKFDCNIQQIKTDCFDRMYYLLFFYDVIELFEISSEQITSDANLNYSDKQHRGNIGEGQFHVTQNNYAYHKSKYFVQTLTYDKIKELLLKQRKPRTKKR